MCRVTRRGNEETHIDTRATSSLRRINFLANETLEREARVRWTAARETTAKEILTGLHSRHLPNIPRAQIAVERCGRTLLFVITTTARKTNQTCPSLHLYPRLRYRHTSALRWSHPQARQRLPDVCCYLSTENCVESPPLTVTHILQSLIQISSPG